MIFEDACDCAGTPDEQIEARLAAATPRIEHMDVQIPLTITAVCPYRGCRHSNAVTTEFDFDAPLVGGKSCVVCNRLFDFELTAQLACRTRTRSDQPETVWPAAPAPIKAMQRYDAEYLITLAPEQMDHAQAIAHVTWLRARANDLVQHLLPFSSEAVLDNGLCHLGIVSKDKCVRCRPILEARAAIDRYEKPGVTEGVR